MRLRSLTFWVGTALFVSACSEPPPPRSVQEFLDNPIVLEAALVRCGQNRVETRYDAECVNARKANRVVMAEEEAKRREAFEVQSQRKREALRRAQAAAAEARRRAEEQQRLREEAKYLAQFGEVPEQGTPNPGGTQGGNEPGAVLPEPVAEPETDGGYSEPLAPSVADGANAPTVETEPEPEPEPEPEAEQPSDLADIREELRRRNEE